MSRRSGTTVKHFSGLFSAGGQVGHQVVAFQVVMLFQMGLQVVLFQMVLQVVHLQVVTVPFQMGPFQVVPFLGT